MSTELTSTNKGKTYTTIGRDNPDLQFYVYLLWVEGEEEPFYVGKGQNGRLFDHVRNAVSDNTEDTNRHKSNKIRKALRNNKKIIHEIIWETDKEEEAFEIESSVILHYGRQDNKTGCLTNLNDGGEGTTGLVHTEEARKKMSESAFKKPVVQISFFGEIVEIYESSSEAERQNEGCFYQNIHKCCQQFANSEWRASKGERCRHYKDHFWAYFSDLQEINPDIKVGDFVPREFLPDSPLIARLSKDGTKILEVYDGNNAAGNSNEKFNTGHISSCCIQYASPNWRNSNGKRNLSHAGFKWSKVQDLPQELYDECFKLKQKFAI